MPRPPASAETGPWFGMYDSFTEVPAAPGFAHYLENCRPLNPAVGGPLVSRLGVTRIGTTGIAAGAQILTVFAFYKADGSLVFGRLVHDAGAGGAHIDTWNGTTTWTTVVAASVLNTASINYAATTEAWWVEFNNGVVFSDGASVPWFWDGTAAGGVTKLTNAPVAYGKPTIYYGKLFLIKNTERTTIVWSEENDATTGYEAGGYNNAWTLSQTGTRPLWAILGTNQALYYFRADSIGAIRGAVNSDFTTTGVHDAVSRVLGTWDFRSVVHAGADIWFISPGSQIYVMPEGGPPIEVTPGILRASNANVTEPYGFATDNWSRSGGVTLGRGISFSFGFTRGLNQVWFLLPSSAGKLVLVYDAETRRCQGFNTFPLALAQLHALPLGIGIGPVPVLVTTTTAGSASSGANTVWHAASVQSIDEYYDGAFQTQAVSCVAVDAPQFVSPDGETRIDRLDLVAFVDTITASTQVTFTVRTLSAEYPSASVVPTGLTQTVTTSAYVEQHLAYGMRTIGRWVRPVISWTGTTGAGFSAAGVKQVRVTGYPLARPVRVA